jgi:hypothetical protein
MFFKTKNIKKKNKYILSLRILIHEKFVHFMLSSVNQTWNLHIPVVSYWAFSILSGTWFLHPSSCPSQPMVIEAPVVLQPTQGQQRFQLNPCWERHLIIFYSIGASDPPVYQFRISPVQLAVRWFNTQIGSLVQLGSV